MQFDLTDEESSALRELLVDTIEYDRYPLSPRIRMLRGILTKFRADGTPATTAGPAPDGLLTTGSQGLERNCDRSFPMPDDTALPVPVWSVKFFRDLRSLTPTRLAYISRFSEAEVAQRAPRMHGR
jgi:hypothetical protein